MKINGKQVEKRAQMMHRLATSNDTRKNILSLLSQEGALTTQHIAFKLKKEESEIRNHISILKRVGEI